MHRPLSQAEIEALNTAVPVMTKAQKLERWAQIIDKSPIPLSTTHGLEYCASADLLQWRNSPMALAAADPVFQDAGLTGTTVGDVRKFFELSNEELHSFSCDCHGSVSNAQMSQRLRNIAAGTSR